MAKCDGSTEVFVNRAQPQRVGHASNGQLVAGDIGAEVAIDCDGRQLAAGHRRGFMYIGGISAGRRQPLQSEDLTLIRLVQREPVVHAESSKGAAEMLP